MSFIFAGLVFACSIGLMLLISHSVGTPLLGKVHGGTARPTTPGFAFGF